MYPKTRIIVIFEIKIEKKYFGIYVTSFSSISYYSNSEIDLKNWESPRLVQVNIPDRSPQALSRLKRWAEFRRARGPAQSNCYIYINKHNFM